MRILHLTDRLSERGGAHWHLRAVIERLRAAGHEVALAAGAVDDGATAPCPLHLVPGLEARDRRAVELSAALEAARPDVVHVHTVMNPDVLEWAGGQPAVITVQDHRYFCPAQGKWTAAGAVCREVMRRDTCAACFGDDDYFAAVYGLTEARLRAVQRLRVVVLSHYMKAELVAAGVASARVAVIPPFVHGLDARAAPDGPPCVLFAGRLTAGKGAREAVEAWRTSGVDLPLVVAGTGPLRAEVEQAGADVLGWVPHARLSAVYRRARALVLPSRWQEPFGIVGLEALAMGTPVAAWHSGGVAEWHPGGGLRARWGDVPGLSRALQAAVAGPRAVAPPGFDAEVLMHQLLAVYDVVRREGAPAW